MSESEGQVFRPNRTFEINGARYGARLLAGDAVGSTSFVYLAYRLLPDGGTDGKRLILKRFLTPTQKLFEIERDVLEQVAALDKGELGQHFPRVIATHQAVFEGQSSFLLLMEHAGDQPVADRLPLKEAEALALIRHYLACLRTLFATGFTCWDRKTKDFYWTSPAVAPPDGELRVIDWNMAEPYHLMNAHNDLVKAGQLAYELLTGHPLLRRKGSTTYQFDPEWRRVSFGTQQIIRALLTGVPDLVRSDVSGQDTKQSLQTRVKGWERRCKEIEGLLKAPLSKTLMEEAATLLEQRRFTAALERTSLAALRISSAADGWEGKVDWNTADWKRIHETAVSEAMRALDAVGPLRQGLEDGQTPVTKVAQDLEQLLRDNTQLSPEQELSAARWLLLARSFAEAGDDVGELRLGAVRALEDHEKDLAQGLCSDAQTRWDALLSLPNKHPSLLRSFRIIRAEAQIRDLEGRAADARQRGEHAQALAFLQAIDDGVRALRRMGSPLPDRQADLQATDDGVRELRGAHSDGPR